MAIVLDWDQYYQHFADAHGGDPIVVGNYLLFGDGWRYNLDTEGDELSPPVDPVEQLELKRFYWTMRINILTEDAKQRIRLLRNLIVLQEDRSETLQYVFKVNDTDKDGKYQTKSTVGDLPLESLTLEVAGIVEKIQLARETLTQLTYTKPTPNKDLSTVKAHLIELEEQL
jgi:hypothetical protein